MRPDGASLMTPMTGPLSPLSPTGWARGMVHATRLGTRVFDAMLAMIERRPPAIFEAQIRALLNRPDTKGVLENIGMATLVVCGRDDQWSPLARHEQMTALIPGARFEVIEDSGHLTTMEPPEFVASVLINWLAGPARC